MSQGRKVASDTGLNTPLYLCQMGKSAPSCCSREKKPPQDTRGGCYWALLAACILLKYKGTQASGIDLYFCLSAGKCCWTPNPVHVRWSPEGRCSCVEHFDIFNTRSIPWSWTPAASWWCTSFRFVPLCELLHYTFWPPVQTNGVVDHTDTLHFILYLTQKFW